MSQKHIDRASEIIKQVLYITLATADTSGKPWNSPVARFYDGKLNFYWFSDKESVHSQNIRQNQDVFAVIYDSTMAEGTGEGVYIEGIASEINDPTETAQIAGYQTGKWKVEPSQVLGDAIHRFYKLTPTQIWMNDDEKDLNGNYLKDIRVEINKDDLSKRLS